jgi:hypothetical protein
MARLKEPLFHAADLATPQRLADVDRYRSLFAGGADAVYRAETTPWYLFSRVAAESIHEMSPDAHIIVHLRRPSDMLASLHNHHVFVGLEPEPDFERAVFGDHRTADPDEFRRGLDYLAVARVGEQVVRFQDRFPPDRIHYVLFRDMVRSPRDTHLALLRELGLEEIALPRYGRHNAARRVRSQRLGRAAMRLAGRAGSPAWRRVVAAGLTGLNAIAGREPVPAEAARRINARLADDVARLQELSGQDLSEWRAT